MKKFSKLFVAIAATLLISNQAHAFLLVMNIAAPSKTMTLRTGALLVGVSMLMHPIMGVAMLLDGSDDSFGKTVAKIQTYGCSEREARALTVLLQNAGVDAYNAGEAVVVPPEAIAEAAPAFSQTSGYKQMIAESTVQQ